MLIFGFQWVYFNFFEWLWNGQTPGKRLLHLRVIKVDGSPVSGIDVLLRNLSRPIDTLGPMGLIGLLMIFVSRKAQRLGDLMARTLVIHETRSTGRSSIRSRAPATAASGTAATPAIRLTSAQWELLHRYLNRREQLRERRARASGSFAPRKLEAGGQRHRSGTLSTLAPEDWLVELARRT